MTVVTRRPPPDERFGTVNAVWKGETVVILGGGPSLTAEQVERCRGLKCIAVNDQYLIAPWADVLYFADAKWFSWHRTKAEFKAFAGIKVSIENSMPQVSDQSVLILKNANGVTGNNSILSADPGAIGTGSNSAFQALNIAVLTGASRILLLGVDGKDGPGGKRHHFGDHPDKSGPPYDAMKAAFAASVPALKALGVEVINCSPGSRIDHFPMMSLEDALAGATVVQPRPAAPDSKASYYVQMSEALRAGDVSTRDMDRLFPDDRQRSHALGKGIKKRTFVLTNGVWRHFSRLVVDS